ncbi:DUF6090 family protein [Muriicola soli]|uniref:Uncharacterized protein n=1 Tax=Muriicola soli TaxID=2507538 RepID=A0A411E8F4_9FLAO|nr:DUF6090 family protein [Muriicola soli]QBA63962.1 hypothetical protein EQY75_05070 [Muriicola soli]
MIQFFRKIRKSLLTQGKIGKYIPYALGEIFLVVVGILLALQINNWNEHKKQKSIAKELLKDIEISLANNYTQLNFVINYNQEGNTSAELIKHQIQNNLPYHDSLDLHFSKAIQYSTPVLKNPGYESLKVFGLNLVENDSLIKALGDFYNMGWIETLVFRQESYYYGTASPILVELFESVAMRNSMKPFNYNTLLTSNEYLSILNTMIAYRKDQNVWYFENLQQLDEIKNMISEELQKP